MSKIFYDHLIVLEEVEIYIRKVAKTPDEKEELWRLIDEIIHHRVMYSLLEKLPEKHHNKFLNTFFDSPYDDNLIPFLNKRINEDVEEFIRNEVKSLSTELLRLVEGKVKK